jgi:cytochrome c-type biogenesis protein CcsB
MTYFSIENFLENLSFATLLLTMLLYWIQASFFLFKNMKFVGYLGVLLSNVLLMSILILRWIESNHFPLSNLYESLIFLAWSLTLFQIIFEKLTTNSYIGIINTPIAMFITAFASFTLPTEMQQSSPLVPALQSNWLMMHVTIMILSYAALISGSLFSISFLVINFSSKKTDNGPVPNDILILEKNLDILSYRALGLGFPLLTIGILSGAVWANETWGSYWSWDPKETWAFITWVTFAIYLHTRIVKGWSGEKPALIASIGFLVVWVCFLGVNLFGKGLHSYGWISDFTK